MIKWANIVVKQHQEKLKYISFYKEKGVCIWKEKSKF